ncbi:MAG: DUF2927 domain-containing protein [Planktomarina sp.]
MPKIIFKGLAAFITAAFINSPTDLHATPYSGPTMKSFGGYVPTRPGRPNKQMAQDFLDLHFRLETGIQLSTLSKFDGKITYTVQGQMPRSLQTDFATLLGRLQSEAKIQLHPSRVQSANINIIMVPQTFIKAQVNNAACFTVPNVRSKADFAVQKRARNLSWTNVRARQTVAVFLPKDAPPQQMRDCLHEELAQALGPLNDLYRLPDSVFNDDGFHKVLTGFDMLMLRTLYHPTLKSGMTKQQVAAKLPGLLGALNPKGANKGRRPIKASSAEWTQSMTYALYSGASVKRRLQAAERAILSEPTLKADVRKGFALYTMARLSMAGGSPAAQKFMSQADHIFASNSAMAIHRADLAIYRAAYLLHSGHGQKTMDMIRPHIKAAYRHQDARTLAKLLFYQAEALKLTGRVSEAHVVRLDAQAWARYGYGKESAVQRIMRDIASLSPANVR